MNKKEIDIIYNNLKNKFVYSDKENFKGFYIVYNNIRKYYLIRYNNFGSSAIKFNKKNLKWLIENIFDNNITNLQPKKDGCIYY